MFSLSAVTRSEIPPSASHNNASSTSLNNLHIAFRATPAAAFRRQPYAAFASTSEIPVQARQSSASCNSTSLQPQNSVGHSVGHSPIPSFCCPFKCLNTSGMAATWSSRQTLFTHVESVHLSAKQNVSQDFLIAYSVAVCPVCCTLHALNRACNRCSMSSKQ